MLLTAPDISPKKDEMIAKEIQEMRDALQAFQTAIEAREVAGFENGAEAEPNPFRTAQKDRKCLPMSLGNNANCLEPAAQRHRIDPA